MPRKPIPISAARDIAERYDYDQVVIYARKIGEAGLGGEHMTTYSRNPTHCSVASLIADRLQQFMGWSPDTTQQKESD